MFHVDPKSDTQGSLNTSDDVIVTMEGNVGIGILPDDAASPPTLTLTGGGTPSVPRSPLRIVDGNQQEGRVLTGDAAGQGTWKDLPAGFIPGRVYGLRDIPAARIPLNATIYNPMLSGFSFTADAAGSYIFEVRWWGRYTGEITWSYIHFYLYKGSTTVDQFEQYAGFNSTDVTSFTVCFSLYSTAVAGDVFTLRLRQASDRDMDTQAGPAWTQSRVNILRVN